MAITEEPTGYVPSQTCLDVLKSNPSSYVMDCFIKSRNGETLFVVADDGKVEARLIGYAIVPIEEWGAR